MIEKFILVSAFIIALTSQKNIPNICYYIGKIIRKIQNLTHEAQNLFWSLYDIGEINHFQKKNDLFSINTKNTHKKTHAIDKKITVNLNIDNISSKNIENLKKKTQNNKKSQIK